MRSDKSWSTPMHIVERQIIEDIENGRIGIDALKYHPNLVAHLTEEKQALWKRFCRESAPRTPLRDAWRWVMSQLH